MSFSEIEIKELRVANWQGVDVKIPNYCWTAISGPSGSGKTSLLFSGLDAWSAQQFELLRDPFAIVGPFEGQQIAASISSLLPVLASAGEIPRRRFGATIFNILNLHAVLDSTWKQFGEYKCSSCNENWRPDGSESALKKISQAATLNSKIHIVSSLAQQTKADVLLAQGLTRFFNGQELQRIEDQQDVVTAGGWLLHDRVKGVDGNESRLVEALLVAMARHERVAAFIDNNFVEFAVEFSCPNCGVAHNYQDQSLQVIAAKTVTELMRSNLGEWRILAEQSQVASPLKRVLAYASRCGLQHLQVDRQLKSLSLGEARRIELMVWIAQARRGQTLIFDEPGIGLHGQERLAVAELFQELARQGNTVITADPCKEFSALADHCLVVGPGAGSRGGTVCASGRYADLNLPTQHGFSSREQSFAEHLCFDDLSARHLDIKQLKIPMQAVVAVCGVSGSGKSTLFADELWPRLKEMQKHHPQLSRGGVHALLQRSLGISARSTLATLSGCWQEIRELCASTTQAKRRGFAAGDFVASLAKGACRQCQGLAVDQFGNVCVACDGLALRCELLDIQLRGATLRHWLSTPISELSHLLPVKSKLRQGVELLIKFGLGERRLGERGKVFSFGERGRIALANKLSLIRPGSKKLFLLDEACLGLPDAEAQSFLNVLQQFCVDGHSFWLIEHHESVLRGADWLIEIGPQAAENGGKVVFEGYPSQLAQATTATSKWLSDTVEAIACKDKVELQQPQFTVLADGFGREGYKSLVQSYAQELSMRSVLDSDMINHAVTGDSINQPTAWPAIIADSTPLLDVLGLKGQIELLLNRHGQLRCSNCGGLGPVKSVNEVTNRYLTTQDLAVVCEAPSAIAGHPNQKQWLAAAGYRDFINGDEIVIDRLPQGLSADELSERCQDIEIQLRQLGHTKFSIHDNSDLPLATFDLNNCQDCKQQHSLEARLNGKSLADIYDSAVGNALDFFAHLNCPILKHATKLLKPTSLLTHKSKSKMSRLTSVEQRCARIVSLLLFAPQSLGLLFDNIFAGFPARLGQFLASECETSRLLMTHADASGYFGQLKSAALKSTLTLSPVSFSSNFAFEDFIPGRAKPDVSLLAALELEYDLADYFSRSETAKLIGLSSADFIKQKSKHKCQSCKGNGYIQIHPYFYYACILCRGSSFDHTMSQVVERGLSFTQAVRSTIAKLQVYFSGTKLEAVLSNAVELGLGDYTLSQPMAELPAASRSIAPLCNYLGQREGEIRIRGLFDGLSCLQAQQVSTRIQSLGFIHSILEWRENHPQVLNEP